VNRLLLALLLGALAVVAWALLRVARRRRLAAARSDFLTHRTEHEQQFLAAARASGKPRGLRWKECRFHDGAQFARDRATGEQIALVGVTIGFEAIEGGDMEDVEAVGNLRCATAVFTHNGHEWTTIGRAVFNLEPPEVLTHYAESLEPVAAAT
jgi:hypothetical protein